MQEEGSRGNVRFRPRRLRGAVAWDDAESRFVTGLVVFIVAALLYPWYEYRVQSWLAARDIAVATKALETEAKGEAATLQRELAAATRRASEPAYSPPSSIRLMGAMDLRDGPMAIVDLAGRPLDDVASIICLRVQETLDTPTTGLRVRVQRWRRNAPAVSMGSIQC